jgi:uncharacterized protein (TIGR02172 family)
MSIISSTVNSDNLVIALSGHIDSNNAAELEAEIQQAYQPHPELPIIVDADKLEYISSAGLRVLLRLRKSHPQVKVINVSPEIYEIFDMTGFTEIIPIEKAYRQVSIEGCEIIGRGSNGEVYRIDPDTIIKVYRHPNSLDEIHRERELARKAFVMGIPTAIPYDVVKVDGTYGSVFELLSATSFSKLIKAHPEDIMKYITLSVDLLKKIHSTTVAQGDLPEMNVTAKRWVEDLKTALPQDQWQKLSDLISAIPASYQMLHGDYHTKNLMMQNGEVLLIDMDTLCVGNPIFEFSCMYNAYVGFDEIRPREQAGAFLGLNYEQQQTIWHETLKQYFQTDDQTKLQEVTDKARIISYARILRRTLKRDADSDYGQVTIKNCREKLAELLPKVDQLAI